MTEKQDDIPEDITSAPRVESPELLWQAVGLLEPPSGSSEGIARAKESLLKQGHAHGKLRAEAGEASDTWPLSTPHHRAGGRRFSLATRAAVVAAMLFAMGFLSVRVVEARRDRLANEGFALKALGFALDLYEEDVLRLEKDAALLRENLPTASGWTYDALSLQQAEACSKALIGLAAVRRGNPFAALSELEDCLANYKSLEENDRLPIMNCPFEIIVGVTCLESVRMIGQRGQVYSAEFVSASDGVENFLPRTIWRVREAIRDLQAELPDYPIENRELLICALLADLARHSSYKQVLFDQQEKLLPGGLPLTQLAASQKAYDQAIGYLDEASAALDALTERDERWWSQYARVLNIRMLVECRYCWLDGLESQYSSESNLQTDWSEKVQLVVDFVEGLEPEQGRAVRFELAICYSNWADWYRNRSIFGFPNAIPDVEFSTHQKLRHQALRILETAPRQTRSERHIENIALNLSHDLMVSAVQSTLTGKLQENLPYLRERATRLHFLLGDLLNFEIGQVNPVEAIFAAQLLPDIYSAERVEASIEAYRNNPNDFSESFNRMLILVSETLNSNG